MQITGTPSIVGTLVLQLLDAFSRSYRSVSITNGQHVELPDIYRFDTAITNAVTGGFITIALETEDRAVQSDLTGGGGTDPDSVQTQSILATDFTITHNNKKIVVITTDAGNYISDTTTAVAAGSAVGQRLLILIPSQLSMITIKNGAKTVLSGDWFRDATGTALSPLAWLQLEWDGTNWNEIGRDDGQNNIASGSSAHAEGQGSVAFGPQDHAEGSFSLAFGGLGHAEGDGSRTFANGAHAEGSSEAIGENCHSEGTAVAGFAPDNFIISGVTITISGNAVNRFSNGDNVFFAFLNGGTNNTLNFAMRTIETDPTFDGSNTTFDIDSVLDDRTSGIVVDPSESGRSCHAEGNSIATGDYSHAEGASCQARGDSSHAEGNGAIAYTQTSHAEGNNSNTYGANAHAEGEGPNAVGDDSHAEGENCIASAYYSHAEGLSCLAGLSRPCTFSGTTVTFNGDYVRFIPNGTQVRFWGLTGGVNNTVFVQDDTANGASFSGSDTTFNISTPIDDRTAGRVSSLIAFGAHAEGNSSFALGIASHAEGGNDCFANGDYSHAEGDETTADGHASHSQGFASVARQTGQHAVSSGIFIANGDAQATELLSRNQTTDGTPTFLYVNGSNESILIADKTTYGYSIKTIARQTGGTSACAYFESKGFITRDTGAGTTRIVNGSSTSTSDASASTWTVIPSADATTGALAISVTGEAGKTILWVAHVELVETIES